MEERQTFLSKSKSFLLECKRVLKVTRKPTKDEFKTIVKVTALGMVVMGLIGFVIVMITQYIT
tara:strand:- start:863 stop:1051 length:189 start_codon:yes stop_codon:yes gene_type:complete